MGTPNWRRLANKSWGATGLGGWGKRMSAKNHKHWDEARQRELDRAVERIWWQLLAGLVAAIAFAYIVLPDNYWFVLGLFLTAVIFFVYGGSLVAAYLKRFDRRFQAEPQSPSHSS
jgi:hypothetical protein